MYSRNRFYINREEQRQLRDFRILLAGAGLGSVIAECALRMGFENITIIDGDVVERSNLNRQNYTCRDTGKAKAPALQERLTSINPEATIKSHCQYLTTGNMSELINDCDVVINAIDFTSEAPFLLDRICIEKGITALHPYNLGWAACVFTVNRESQNLSYISDDYHGFELKFADYIIRQLRQQGYDIEWFSSMIEQYGKEALSVPPPQLSAASWIVAGICADILFCLATGKKVKLFPDFYFGTVH